MTWWIPVRRMDSSARERVDESTGEDRGDVPEGATARPRRMSSGHSGRIVGMSATPLDRPCTSAGTAAGPEARHGPTSTTGGPTHQPGSSAQRSGPVSVPAQNSSGPGLVRAGARQDRCTAGPGPARTRACPDAEPPGRGPARSRPCQDSALDDTQHGTRTSTGLDSVHPAGARKTDQQEPRTGPVVPRTARYGVCMVIIVGPLSARSLRYCSGSVRSAFIGTSVRVFAMREHYPCLRATRNPFR